MFYGYDSYHRRPIKFFICPLNNSKFGIRYVDLREKEKKVSPLSHFNWMCYRNVIFNFDDNNHRTMDNETVLGIPIYIIRKQFQFYVHHTI